MQPTYMCNQIPAVTIWITLAPESAARVFKYTAELNQLPRAYANYPPHMTMLANSARVRTHANAGGVRIISTAFPSGRRVCVSRCVGVMCLRVCARVCRFMSAHDHVIQRTTLCWHDAAAFRVRIQTYHRVLRARVPTQYMLLDHPCVRVDFNDAPHYVAVPRSYRRFPLHSLTKFVPTCMCAGALRQSAARALTTPESHSRPFNNGLISRRRNARARDLMRHTHTIRTHAHTQTHTPHTRACEWY